MARMIEALIQELEQEAQTTRRVLERVPGDKLAWKPHDKSWSMGELASHIVNMIKWTDVTMNATEFDMGGRGPMKGWLRVDNSVLGDDKTLGSWVQRGVAYARTLPPKKK